MSAPSIAVCLMLPKLLHCVLLPIYRADDCRYGNFSLVLQMDLSALYGAAQVQSKAPEVYDGALLRAPSMPGPKSCQELHIGSRDSGGRTLHCEEYGALHHGSDRLNGISSLHEASKLKAGYRKPLSGPQQKGPTNLKRGYRQVLLVIPPS